MPKKKKSQAIKQEVTPIAQDYLNLWFDLNASHDEKEIDAIRHRMNDLWSTMTDGDKRDFHRESDEYERKHKFEF